VVYEASVLWQAILGALALLSLVLTLWQWVVARRFPLHERILSGPYPPALTILKPLKGYDATTEECLRSWFLQNYAGHVQLLFGVDSADDPVCDIVHLLMNEFRSADAQLVLCGPPTGTNAKVSKLVELERAAKHEAIIISDADVRVPPDLLATVVEPLREPHVGMVNCFYHLANPTTMAMRWEAVAMNADFWSQVLQAQSLKPIDFALGAVMGTRRTHLAEIGGFEALVDCLADDYQLGNRIGRRGHQIVLSPVVVECWSAPQGWATVWKHQLRWARTIRVSQPLPYFFSILGNSTLWPLLWMVLKPSATSIVLGSLCLLVRLAVAWDLQKVLTRRATPAGWLWMPWLKDLLQTMLWALAFLGNRVEWRGQRMKLRRDGTLVRG
jgi:ceramide glucosyltransferase